MDEYRSELRKKTWQRRLAAFLVLCLAGMMLVVPSLPAPASNKTEIEKLQEKLAQSQDSLAEVKKQIKATNKELVDLDGQLLDLETQLRVLGNEISATNQSIGAVNLEIEDANQAIADATLRLEARQAQLEKRVHDSYVNGNPTFIDVFFEAKSFEEFVIYFDYFEMILQQDKELLDGIFAERTLIEESKATLEARKADLEQIKQMKESRSNEVQALSEQKERILASTKLELSKLEKFEDQMIAESKNIEKEIKKLQQASTNVYNGSMKWPLSNSYTNRTSEYGMRIHPIFKTKKMHTGVDIGAPSGVPIYAASSGTVLIAGWNSGGYGNYVVIDHGSGISTLYAHMSSVGCKAGQNVKTGDTIGYVGSTGNSTGPHLHFEVRINGQHTSPKPYLGY